jgi:hypothetical protein
MQQEDQRGSQQTRPASQEEDILLSSDHEMKGMEELVEEEKKVDQTANAAADNPPAEPARKRQMRAFGVEAPARKRADDGWEPDDIEIWASSIEDPLPPRPREESTKAIVAGTLEKSLGIRTAIRTAFDRAGLEFGNVRVIPDEPDNTYCVTGLTRATWATFSAAVGSLHRKNEEVPITVAPPQKWLDHEDLSVYIVPFQRLVPEDVATGYPEANFVRPIRILRVYGPTGDRRKEVRAVFDSLETRERFLNNQESFTIHGKKAKVFKTINTDPKPRQRPGQQEPNQQRGRDRAHQPNQPRRHPNRRNRTPPGHRARRGRHE